jgi:hypothetical protein
MTFRELQKSFEILALSYVNTQDKPVSDEIEFWLNRGLDKFVKTRYSGVNYKRESFEQSQKRIDDLRTLVTTHMYDVSDNSVQLPTDYLFALGETTGILPVSSNTDAIDCWERDDETGQLVAHYGDVLEATVENVDRQLQNSLSEHLLHRSNARPLRLFQNNTIYFYTDGKYYVRTYKLTYLKKPVKIDLHSNPGETYTDMPEHTHEEIVKLAVEMFLENRQNPRYQSFLTEVSTME